MSNLSRSTTHRYVNYKTEMC
uniref:Uncharacterized protein n=1 Tax=Anguilla anguilla TaxID=7936 RepID=A0A0E9RTV1_ANGAN